MANNRFGRNGAYVCAECGKLTRDTGSGEAGVGLCRHCLEVAEYVNSVNDGDLDIEEVPEKYRKDVQARL